MPPSLLYLILLLWLSALTAEGATSSSADSSNSSGAATTDSPPAPKLPDLKESDIAKIPPSPPVIGGEKNISLEDALEMMLRRSPTIEVSRGAVQLAAGQYQEAIGAFDTTLQSTAQGMISEATQDSTYTNPFFSAAQGGPPLLHNSSPLRDNELKANAGLTRLFRNGLSAGPYLGVTSDMEGSADKSTDAFLGFFVNIPLARNLGEYSQYTTLEKASKVQLEAARLSLEADISKQILQVLNDYWELLSAQEAVKVSLINEEDGKKIVTLTQALVDGYLVPSTQLLQAKANLEQFSTQRIASRQKQSQSSQALAVSIGMGPEELFEEPVATESFPKPHQHQISTDTVQQWVKVAVERRPEIRAAILNTRASEIMVLGARNAARPQIDLAVGAGGISDGTVENKAGESVDSNTLGAGFGASLTIDWPFRNNAAKGMIVQRLAQRNQARAQSDLTRNQIASEVILASKGLINAAHALKETTAAVENQRKSLDAIQEQYSMGLASLVEVITTQTSLSTFELALIEAQQGYASALAQLHYATGTLLPPVEANGYYRFDLTALAKLPPRETTTDTP